MNTKLNIKYLLTTITSVVILCSCVHGGTYKFSGPGDFQQFAQVRYQCLQETSVRQSGAFVNSSGGAATSTVTPNCSAFDACLAAKGYYRNPNGNLDASSIPISCR